MTEARQANRSLKISEEKFQGIVASVPGMVYQFAMHDSGKIEWSFVSEGCQEIFESSSEALREDELWLLGRIHPADRPGFERSVATAAESMSPWRWEGRHQRPSGEIGWIQGSSLPQRLDNQSTQWNGIVIDVTARRKAERERDRFFSTSLDMLCIAGMDGHFRRVNPAFTEILGFTEAEMQEKTFLEWTHVEDRAATLAVVDELAHGQQISGFENRYPTKDGNWKWLEWRKE
ncbi:MAG: PAS domain S-box protein [Cytophagaceae bacterium]|nr:MAG: PAS domain S-box protein [Cytophagaceae bacterium]